MSQAKARAYIQTESAKAYNTLVDEWKDLQKQNQEAMDDSFWGGLIGSIGLPILMTLGGPISIATAALSAGAGSYIGQKAGETDFGRGPGVQGGEAIESVGLRADLRGEIMGKADITEQAFDDQVLTNALQSAATSYIMAGGQMPGTVGFKEAGGLPGLFSDATGSAAFGGLSLKGAGESLYDFYLSNRSVSNMPYYGNIAQSPLSFN